MIADCWCWRRRWRRRWRRSGSCGMRTFLCLVAELLTKSDSGTHLVSLLLSISLWSTTTTLLIYSSFSLFLADRTIFVLIHFPLSLFLPISSNLFYLLCLLFSLPFHQCQPTNTSHHSLPHHPKPAPLFSIYTVWLILLARINSQQQQQIYTLYTDTQHTHAYIYIDASMRNCISNLNNTSTPKQTITRYPILYFLFLFSSSL